jgi:hypothetical protein
LGAAVGWTPHRVERGERVSEPIQPGGPVATDRGGTADAWNEYLLAARRLDAVRRGAVTAAGEQAQSVQTAREELTGVRARLVPQQSRLCDLGVPKEALIPSHPEVAVATRAMARGPEAVLAALRRARATIDAADARVAGADRSRPLARLASWPLWARYLLIYGLPVLALLVALACIGAGAALIFT